MPPRPDRPHVTEEDLELEPGSPALRVIYRRHSQAVRYRLTLQRDGTARCTLPPRGNFADARKFVLGCRGWLIKRRAAQAQKPTRPRVWLPGTPVWFRGERHPLTRSTTTQDLLLGPETVLPPPGEVTDLRPHVETWLRRLATKELPRRVQELALLHGFRPSRVSIRNQRSRWGSCSARQVISLNWRLIQTPDSVRDYVILHELVHTRHLNHSKAFWTEVARLCPDYALAERWLKAQGGELL
jgi:predicted metal-dependent hydrolase